MMKADFKFGFAVGLGVIVAVIATGLVISLVGGKGSLREGW
jgi:hypothetical protein